MHTVTWMEGGLMAQKVWRSSDSHQVFWFKYYKLFFSVIFKSIPVMVICVSVYEQRTFHHDYVLSVLNFKMSVISSESRKMPYVSTTGSKYFE